ncbi:MAG: hypothetical protein ACX94A_10560 [Algiphilus sp.]
MRFMLMQAESKLLQNVQGRLNASHNNTMDRVSELESQLRRLRSGRLAREAARQSRISDLLAGEAHEDWCEIGRSQQLADLAKNAQSAEQRMARTQLWAREQLRRMATAHADSLEAFSQSCKSSYEHAERTITSMRQSLEDARRRLAVSREQLKQLRMQGTS